MSDADGTQPNLPMELARWAEQRLNECVGFWFTAPRLYSLELLDRAVLADPGHQGARMTFVDEGADESDLVLGESGLAACSGDAVVMVASRWATCDGSEVVYPSRHPPRRRARVVTVIGDDGTATAVRFEHDDAHVVLSAGLSGGGAGGIQLAAVWHGVRGVAS